MPTPDPATQLRALVADLAERQKQALAQGAVLILHGESFLDRLAAMLDGRTRSGIDPALHEVVANSVMGQQPPVQMCFVTASDGWPEPEEGWARSEDYPWQRMKQHGIGVELRCDRCGGRDNILHPIAMAAFANRLRAFGEAHAGCQAPIPEPASPEGNAPLQGA